MTVSSIAFSGAAQSIAFGTTAQAGDLIFVTVYGSAPTGTNVTLPAGYTVIDSDTQLARGNPLWGIVGYKIAVGGETSTGNFSSSVWVAGSIYRTSIGTLSIGAHVKALGPAVNTASIPALTASVADGSSWIIGATVASTGTVTLPANLTTRISSQTFVKMGDTNGGATSYAGGTATNTQAALWFLFTVELKVTTVVLDPRSVSGAQTLQAATQTGSIGVSAGISGSQTTKAITQTSSISVRASGVQYLQPITQSGAIGVVAKITGSQTLAPITQTGRSTSNITGVQTLPRVKQVNSIGTSPTPRRIMLGKLPNGNNGLRISQPGYDTGNDPIDNEKLIFSSEWNEALPIYMTGFQRVAMGIGNQGPIVTVSFPSLGYIPYVEFTVRSPADAYPPGSDKWPDTTRYIPRNALPLASWAPYDGVDGCEFLRLLITDGQLRFEGETRWNNNNTFGLPETWWIYWVIFKKRVN